MIYVESVSEVQFIILTITQYTPSQNLINLATK